MKRLKLKFCDYIPDELDSETIYVSIVYKTAVHLCACGCRNEVVTPISPYDWSLKYNGESISLNPSIGNWSFQCRSHYWIKNNRVIFCWDDENESITKAPKRSVSNSKEDLQPKKNAHWFGRLSDLFRVFFWSVLLFQNA